MPHKIVYYKSAICPRCIPTNRMLKAFRQQYPQVEIEEVEVLRHLKRAREAGVGQVPTLVVGPHRLTRAVPVERLAALVFGTASSGGKEDGP